MNMRSWRLSSQGIGSKPLGKQWGKRRGRGVVKSNFIINCNFHFWFFWWWRHKSCNFSNEYGELETVETGDQAEDFGETMQKASGTGG